MERSCGYCKTYLAGVPQRVYGIFWGDTYLELPNGRLASVSEHVAQPNCVALKMYNCQQADFRVTAAQLIRRLASLKIAIPGAVIKGLLRTTFPTDPGRFVIRNETDRYRDWVLKIAFPAAAETQARSLYLLVRSVLGIARAKDLGLILGGDFAFGSALGLPKSLVNSESSSSYLLAHTLISWKGGVPAEVLKSLYVAGTSSLLVPYGISWVGTHPVEIQGLVPIELQILTILIYGPTVLDAQVFTGIPQATYKMWKQFRDDLRPDLPLQTLIQAKMVCRLLIGHYGPKKKLKATLSHLAEMVPSFPFASTQGACIWWILYKLGFNPYLETL